MRIELPSGTPAELARHDGAQRGLVVVPDVLGLRDLFDDLCARLASENDRTVCAPELFPGREHLAVEERIGLLGGLEDDRILADISAAADATGCQQVDVLGFCLGGMYTLKAAGGGRFHRACAFYGMIRVPEQFRGPSQGEPLDFLAQPTVCPTLAVIGSEDPWTPPDDVAALEQAGVEVLRFEGCGHGFVHVPDLPDHRPAEAKDAWARCLTFLEG